MEKTIVIPSLEEMELFAKKIAELAFPGMIIGLGGDLGSGKTTWTKFFARHMGVNDTLNSPTFTILKIYQGKYPLYHMDVYRLEGIGYDYELDDFIYGDGIAVIEWYDYVKEMLPKEILTMDLTPLGETERKIVMKGSGRYENIIKSIMD